MQTTLMMRSVLLILLIGVAPHSAWATDPEPVPRQSPKLADLDIEDLLKLPVTTASKKPQELSDVPAAVYVITQEEIRRSGATSIPEALRLAPGVQVARIDANKWAITVRGFNNLWSDKLLVLIDGRSVYSPVFSGVFWDAQDLVLEDVDRIEVIRGPGGTLWGANAVNGVINIITRSAKDTQDNLLSTIGGSPASTAEGFHAGQRLGPNTYYRISGKYLGESPISGQGSLSSGDHWDSRRVGLRVDAGEGEPNRLTFETNLYRNNLGSIAPALLLQPPYRGIYSATAPVSGWNALARWEHSGAPGSQRSLQIYTDDATHRQWDRSGETTQTLDIDFQRRQPLARHHDLVWGAGYRRTQANRRLLVEMLASWQMQPTAVESGPAALAALQHAYDRGDPLPIVLLDYMMPGMDGLAVAARIRETPGLAGATIMMLSSAGQRGDMLRCRELGVNVYLTKPIRQAELKDAVLTALSSREPAPEIAPATPHPASRADREHLRILLAEDNVVNQTLAARLLEKRGHRVVIANNGREALAALEQASYDLVLMDVQMPEINGLEATVAIRERERRTGGRVPIIAMTAHAMTGDRERCLGAGMDGYVTKPIRAAELFQTIASLVPTAAPVGGASRPAAAESAARELEMAATSIRRKDEAAYR